MTMPARRNMTLQDALVAAEERFTRSNPKSHAMDQEARRSLPGGNTRSILYYAPFPLRMAGGEGARLFDLDGHTYVDFLGEYTAGLYGHSHPVIQAAAKKALEDGIVLGAPNVYEAELAALMCDRFPSLDLVRFCNSGTEANLNALSGARAVTGRSHVLVFEHAYHGGMMSFTKAAGPGTIPFPFVFGRYNETDYTAGVIEQHKDDLAAIIVEPMMGAGGGIPGDPSFLQMLRDLATRHGIILIFDEVMTSRLSPGGLQQKLGITPDMTTFGKYLGGGLTFGAFGGRDWIMGRFAPDHPDPVSHSGTYNNNVLTMAAGAAGLREVFTPEAAVALNASGDQLAARLNAVGQKLGAPFQVSGVGSIRTIHLQRQPVVGPADTAHTSPDARALFHLEMLERGFYLARRGFMSLSLALNADDHDALVSAVEDFLEEHGPLLEG